MWEALAVAAGSTALDYLGKKKEQKWAKQASQRQMDFQERMSNTAYQRAMADMRQAGINPIMVSKLGGASTPTGAMAKSPDMGKMGSDAMKNYATAQQVKLVGAQQQNLEAQTAKTNAEAKTIKDRNFYEYGSYEGMIKQQELKNLKLQGELIKKNTSSVNLKNEMQTFENKWFINDYGAPSATLTAKVQNYVFSKAFTKMSKKDEAHLIKQIHKGVNFVSSNAQTVLDNPSILYSIIGAYASGFIMDSVLNKVQKLNPLMRGRKNARIPKR